MAAPAALSVEDPMTASPLALLTQRLVDDESAATAIEYALIGIIVSVGIIVALQAFAESEAELFAFIRATVVTAIGS